MFPPPVGKRGVRPFDEVWVFTKGGLVNVNMQSGPYCNLYGLTEPAAARRLDTASYRPGDSTAARAAPICLGGMR
jgi:hypothetical protein